MTGYHVTTNKKLERYKKTGCILPPVRFWKYKTIAEAWMKRTIRDIVLEIEITDDAYPLPDHKPFGHAFWTNQPVREWVML